VNSKDVDTTIRALQHMLGNDTVGLVYSDSHPSLRAACHELGIAWEGPQPGIHQNNAIIERLNADVLAGTRTLLAQAGLPSAFWPLASQCYCHLESFYGRKDSTCSDAFMRPIKRELEQNRLFAAQHHIPWVSRHHQDFPDTPIPFGAGVHYLPSETREIVSKADPQNALWCVCWVPIEARMPLVWRAPCHRS